MNEKYKQITENINTYPKMNETIKDILSRSDEGFKKYILARIVELEGKAERYEQALKEIVESKLTIADGAGNIRIARRALDGME